MAEKFDAVIIGTGQSGPALAARLTREGILARGLEIAVQPVTITRTGS